MVKYIDIVLIGEDSQVLGVVRKNQKISKCYKGRHYKRKYVADAIPLSGFSLQDQELIKAMVKCRNTKNTCD